MTHQFDISKLPLVPAVGTRVLINKRGHTFDGYTGIVHAHHALQGKIKYLEIRLDAGQHMKGGNGFTFVTPKSLIKLEFGR